MSAADRFRAAARDRDPARAAAEFADDIRLYNPMSADRHPAGHRSARPTRFGGGPVTALRGAVTGDPWHPPRTNPRPDPDPCPPTGAEPPGHHHAQCHASPHGT